MDTSSSTLAQTSGTPAPLQGRIADRMADFPWWVLFILLAGVLLIYNFVTNESYQDIILTLVLGVRLTLTVTLTAYTFSLMLGLLTALGQLSDNVIIRNLATLYVQIVRGVPILVQIFYVAFVLVPLVVTVANFLGGRLVSILGEQNFLITLGVRNFSFIVRGIIALAISYGAFSSEIFRAGIQSIERGQIEAGKAVGLSWFQSFRLIILPQAVRRVLPPLGNDFIAMLKESSLVSVLGVGEITQLGKKYAAASFRFPETYNTVAFLYLSMTLVLSMGVRFMERRLKSDE
jgi:polar amino acid transport system permease protein